MKELYLKVMILKVEDSIFADGESPLKESDHIDISGSIF